jgi:hypothetical protein
MQSVRARMHLYDMECDSLNDTHKKYSVLSYSVNVDVVGEFVAQWQILLSA